VERLSDSVTAVRSPKDCCILSRIVLPSFVSLLLDCLKAVSEKELLLVPYAKDMVYVTLSSSAAGCSEVGKLIDAQEPPDSLVSIPYCIHRIDRTEAELSLLEQGKVPVCWQVYPYFGASLEEVEDASMSDYLESFFKHLFPDRQIQVYDYLDGRQLVHYQCAIKKEDWHYVKPAFEEAFLLHRSAFRRAHGGSIGPSLVDVCPARAWNQMCFSGSPQAESMAERDFVETEVVVEKKNIPCVDEPAITRRAGRIETM